MIRDVARFHDHPDLVYCLGYRIIEFIGARFFVVPGIEVLLIDLVGLSLADLSVQMVVAQIVLGYNGDFRHKSSL